MRESGVSSLFTTGTHLEAVFNRGANVWVKSNWEPELEAALSVTASGKRKVEKKKLR